MAVSRKLLGVSIALVAVLTACSTPPRPSPTPTADEKFTAVQEAPSAPPLVEIQGAKVRASYYEWLIDHELVTFKAADSQAEVDLTPIVVDGGQELEVAVQSSVVPADFVVVVFDELDAAGQPVESSSTSIDCLREVDLCKIDVAETSLTASIDITVAEPAIIVVHLMYVSDERSMDEFDHLVGSWGAKVEG